VRARRVDELSSYGFICHTLPFRGDAGDAPPGCGEVSRAERDDNNCRPGGVPGRAWLMPDVTKYMGTTRRNSAAVTRGLGGCGSVTRPPPEAYSTVAGIPLER